MQNPIGFTTITNGYIEKKCARARQFFIALSRLSAFANEITFRALLAIEKMRFEFESIVECSI